MRKAVELNPLTPLFQAHIAWTLHCLDRDEEAWNAVKSGLELHPNDYYLIRILIYCASNSERGLEAIEEAKKVSLASKSAAMGKGILGFAHAKAGDREQAAGIIRELEQIQVQEPGLGYYVGMICALLGEHEKAIVWLERAEQAKLGLLMIVGVETIVRLIAAVTAL